MYCLMKSPLVCLHLFQSKVATLLKAIHSRPYFHMCIPVPQLLRNIGIAVFADITAYAGVQVFAGL